MRMAMIHCGESNLIQSYSTLRTLLQDRSDGEARREALSRSGRRRRPAVLRCVSLRRYLRMSSHSVIGSLMREPELQEFVGLKTVDGKLSYKLPDAVRSAVDRFVMDQDFTLRAPVDPSVGSILATTAPGLSFLHLEVGRAHLNVSSFSNGFFAEANSQM